jgi:ribosome-binding protein aMBF1 (putative translation factor)
MITNERQYRMTRTWLKRFEQAMSGVQEHGDTLDPRARQALLDQYESQVEELRADLEAYDALRRGDVRTLELESLTELPDALIQARTAAGLSQEALARRMGLKKQQVQRWEATRYAGVGLDRLQAVADALGVQIREFVLLPSAISNTVQPPNQRTPFGGT